MAQSEMESLNYVLRLLEAFRAFDADNDGSINAAEVGGIMGSLGYNLGEQDLQEMMQQGDTNNDGLLTVGEFLNFTTKNLDFGGLATSLERIFPGSDFDGEEFVTGEELFEAIRNMGQELITLQDCQRIVASMDGDGDGAISFEDFKMMLDALL